MRTLVDLTERQVAELDRLSKKGEVSRAELVRRAVDRYLAEHLPDREAGFGVWKKTGPRRDGLAAQRRLRKEWSG